MEEKEEEEDQGRRRQNRNPCVSLSKCSTDIIRDSHPVCHQELMTGHQINKPLLQEEEEEEEEG